MSCQIKVICYLLHWHFHLCTGLYFPLGPGLEYCNTHNGRKLRQWGYNILCLLYSICQYFIISVNENNFFYVLNLYKFTTLKKNLVGYYGAWSYRVIQILSAATGSCRSWPWMAGQPPNGASYCRCSQTLALFFSHCNTSNFVNAPVHVNKAMPSH